MRCTLAATPSLPLPPRPVGHFTAVPEPTVSLKSALAKNSLIRILAPSVGRKNLTARTLSKKYDGLVTACKLQLQTYQEP
jgi:hypothetical protein